MLESRLLAYYKKKPQDNQVHFLISYFIVCKEFYDILKNRSYFDFCIIDLFQIFFFLTLNVFVYMLTLGSHQDLIDRWQL